MNKESIYRRLFLNAAEALILTDYQGAIIEVNPKANEMFGYSNEELMGQKVEILVPRESQKKHIQHRNNYSKSPKNRSMGSGMTLFGKRKDDSLFPVEISLNSFSQGEELTTMALVTDITKRFEIEQKIKELNEELESRVEERTQQVLHGQNLYVAIARNFPDGTISIFDKDLSYIFFEGKELYKVGIESDKIIGTNLKDRLPKDVKEKVLDHLSNVLAGESGSIEFESKNQYFELNAVPLKNQRGKIHQILVVERNITRQKRAKEEMLSALHKERALNELKSRFVSMASHEFRTPLSTILSSVSLIDKYNHGQNDEKISKHIGRIKSSVQNLTGILNDFLSLDKLEEGKIRINPSKIKVKEMVDDLVEEMETILKKGQRISLNFQGSEGEHFFDGQIVKNILINLCSNAIKYSEEGKTILLEVKVSEHELLFLIQDQGIGIPEEEQIHMFERFFRAKNVMNIEGTGLGLNIVYKYVELLEGEIDFQSELGKGTKFKVKIPLNFTS